MGTNNNTQTEGRLLPAAEGTGFREAAPTIKTGGVLWLTCWTVVCDLAEARWEHAQTE
ncbi:hypothetical protein DPMN_066927 [Dreissena polymorpha]|uniref:Uncharacterized protein n=1 Tax=Dreissena polymorpha TaxID=45954 RepID=A0A9D3YZW1_DREPO|nr:hypothetical protein DPMN_066927 [Dreissena polymorpha]